MDKLSYRHRLLSDVMQQAIWLLLTDGERKSAVSVLWSDAISKLINAAFTGSIGATWQWVAIHDCI